MKKSAKLSLTLALMMGITGGVQLMDTNTASAEVSDKFRLELNGVTSYYHDTSHNYYGQTRTDSTRLGKGWNNYTRAQLTYYIDKDTKAVARLHSGYDNAGDFAKNSNSTGAYFDQSFLQWDDRKNDMHYLVGKRGMTLGQSMVYNSTGNLTGVQASWGNWWGDRCLQLTYGDNKSGDRIFSAQLTGKTSKATSLNATFVRGEKMYENYAKYTKTKYQLNNLPDAKEGETLQAYVERLQTGEFLKNPATANELKTLTQAAYTSRDVDRFIDFGGKVKFHGVTLVGEWAYNLSNVTLHGNVNSPDARRGYFVELYTGPTNDFGSGLPLQKVGTHAFSFRYQNIGQYGSYVHNNTFYDDKEGFRLDYGVVVKKGLSVDFVYGRMKDKGTLQTKYDNQNDVHKGDWSNIYVLALNYKFR